ncbi:MAG: NYN domain-containing protein [Candidatus Nanohaloarchaeota archaeon QJJ-7]|nr:NYN domain-containing protein [Candidatus Nanohaloarchaeota archaeon QJJ-7]
MVNVHEDQRVAVFVDVQNLYYSAKNLYDRKVNFTNLLQTAVHGRELTRAIAYAIQADTDDEGNFFEALRNIGFEVRTKELKEFEGGAKKGDWDMGIAIDAVKMAEKMDTAVLITGDGDFVSLVNHLQASGVRVEAMAFGKSTAHELKDAVNAFVDLDESSEKYLIDEG